MGSQTPNFGGFYDLNHIKIISLNWNSIPLLGVYRMCQKMNNKNCKKPLLLPLETKIWKVFKPLYDTASAVI